MNPIIKKFNESLSEFKTKHLKTSTEEVRDLISNFEVFSTVFEEKIKDLEEEKSDLEEEKSDLEEEIENLKLKICNLEEQLDDSDIKTNNLYDEMRRNIVVQLFNNLNLQELEELENNIKSKRKNYYII